MSYFLKKGNTFRPTSKESLDLHESLPVGTYVVKINSSREFYLESIDDFEINYKLYGDTQRRSDRILNTFLNRSSNTGVLLVGEKGSGKTLLSKKISIDGAKLGLPTIVVNTSYSGDEFGSFLQLIDQPAIIVFDEFEKVYDSDQQDQILTILDGVYPSKKLFVLTCNDRWRINSHMRNRPGRIYYFFEFKGLAPDFIREYCEDHLNNKDNIDDLVKLTRIFDQFNFDMMKACVEEMNRYDETAYQVFEVLNVRPDNSESAEFELAVEVDGISIDPDKLSFSLININPIREGFSFNYLSPCKDGGDEIRYYLSLTPNDLSIVDSDNQSFVYWDAEEKIRVTLKKEMPVVCDIKKL